MTMANTVPVLASLVGSDVRLSREHQLGLVGRLAAVEEVDGEPVLVVHVDHRDVRVPWSETTRVKQLEVVT